MVKSYNNISEAFEDKVENIESIFGSFRSLYDMYVQIMKSAKINPNTQTAFERMKASADNEQTKISKGLYTQGFILLTGAAEALLKDVFDSLVIENFTSIKVASGINFSSKEVQQAITESKFNQKNFDQLNTAFGKLVRRKLYNDPKNSSEKINFQNVQTMQDIFKQYFGISVGDSSTTYSIHRNWQVRHCVVHNDSMIDERFLNNVNVVGLVKASDVIGKRIVVGKNDYSNAKKDFNDLFEILGREIERLGLKSRFITNPIIIKSKIKDMS